jgi:dephospho-CoA kinase
MRARVFENAGVRKTLEDILHPLIREQVELALGADSAARGPYVMLEVPLLFETTGYWRRARRALVVDCPVDLQRRRVQQRSGLELAEIDRILASQLRRSLRLQLADDVISNSGEAAGLSAQVAMLHARYQTLARAEA